MDGQGCKSGSGNSEHQFVSSIDGTAIKEMLCPDRLRCVGTVDLCNVGSPRLRMASILTAEQVMTPRVSRALVSLRPRSFVKMYLYISKLVDSEA